MRSIAVVEGNADNRLLIGVLLDGRYHLQLYECGVEALQGLRCVRPDLILLDRPVAREHLEGLLAELGGRPLERAS